MSAINQLIATQAQRNKPTSPMQAMAGMQQLDAGRQQQQMNAQRMQMNEQAMQGNAAAMASTKQQEGIKFAANVGAQMRQAKSPEEKAQIYKTSLQIAKMNGHDTSQLPQEFNQDAEHIMEGVYQQVFQPHEMKKNLVAMTAQSGIGKLVADRDRVAQAGGDTSLFDQAIEEAKAGPQQRVQMPTSSQRDFETYRNLKKTDPEAAKEFGRQAGFVSKEGQDLSAHMEKRLSTASDAAIEAGNNVRRLDDLSQQFREADLGSGLWGSTWPEKLKEITGKQDADSELRRAYRQIRTSQAMANLPPGAASEKDVELVLGDFPAPNANPEFIADFLGAMSRIEKVQQDFQEHKARFITKNGHERGMMDAWKAKFAPAESADKSSYSVGQVIEHGGKRYRVTGGDMNDPDVELVE